MNENSHLPKYYQIVQEIIEQIKSGKLEPGARIMSENDIISQYAVSNSTARKVQSELENQGWVYRKRGKGTFVSEKPVSRSANKVLSFSENMKQMGLKPSTKLLEAELMNDDVSIFSSGQKYSLYGGVYKITRLRFANDIPMMREIRYISAKLCPDIIKQNLEGSLYEIYKEQYGITISKINQVLKSVFISDELFKYFDLKSPIAGFLVKGASFFANDTVLEIEESVYRGDKYEFIVEAKQ